MTERAECCDVVGMGKFVCGGRVCNGSITGLTLAGVGFWRRAVLLVG